jgi:hypothetical protein
MVGNEFRLGVRGEAVSPDIYRKQPCALQPEMAIIKGEG